VVTFKNLSRFYTRNNAGKHQMDVAELRQAFAISESLGERLQRFQVDRLSRIIAGETPVPISNAPKMAMHIIPFSGFTLGGYIDDRLEMTVRTTLAPMAAGGWNHRHNIDGFVTYAAPGRGYPSTSYCQFFRTGAVEAVWSDLVRVRDGQKLIASVAYEKYAIESVRRYLDGLRELGVQPPLALLVSMLGVRGAELGVSFNLGDDPTPIDRDTLLLPEVIVEDLNVDVPTVLRPMFDAVWNAAGFVRSFNYDDSGQWNPRR
jgi:hypothetical protein